MTNNSIKKYQLGNPSKSVAHKNHAEQKTNKKLAISFTQSKSGGKTK